MEFEPKDYIALFAAVLTVSSVVWKGGEISSQLNATNEAVRALVPVVNRLDALTSRLEMADEQMRLQISEHARRLENVERAQMFNQPKGKR